MNITIGEVFNNLLIWISAQDLGKVLTVVLWFVIIYFVWCFIMWAIATYREIH